MASDDSFLDMLARVRQGDEQAASAMFRRYEAAVRRAVRLRLFDARLRRVLDSSDVCQMVLASFFQAAEVNRYQIDSEEQLLHLLTEMARKKLISFVRRQEAVRRGGGQNRVELDGELPVADPGDTPSEAACKNEETADRKELAARIRDLFSAEERSIFELKEEEGLEWSEIAARLGGTAEAVRQKYNRARKRVRQQLGQQEADDA